MTESDKRLQFDEGKRDVENDGEKLPEISANDQKSGNYAQKRSSIFTVYKRRPTYTSDQSNYVGVDFMKKANAPFWVTKTMAPSYGREYVLFASLRELVLLLPLIICVTMYSSTIHNRNLHNMKLAIRHTIGSVPFKTFRGVSTTFLKVKTATEIWHFMEHRLLDYTYQKLAYDFYDPIIQRDVHDRDLDLHFWLLGAVRIRQVRTRPDSCKQSATAPVRITHCFALFEERYEDRSPFGLGTKPAWVYSTADETDHISVSGYCETYTGGGYYMDLHNSSRSASYKKLLKLKRSLWITRGTRAVFIHLTMFNANTDIGLSIRLLFEMYPSGAVVPSMVSFPFVVNREKNYPYARPMYYLIIAVVAFNVLEELREMFHDQFRYLLQFWSYVDLGIIILAALTIHHIETETAGFEAAFKKAFENLDQYANFEKYAQEAAKFRDLWGMLVFLCFFKLLKFATINRTLAQINNTAKKCAGELLGFFLQFLIIVVAYADWAVIIFGDANTEFSTFADSLQNTMRAVLGYFRYKRLKTNRIETSATFYYVMFTFTIFFLYLNMYVAILNNTYSDIKTEIVIARPELQVHQYIKKMFWRCFEKHRGQSSSSYRSDDRAVKDEIWTLLSECEKSDIAIYLFLTKAKAQMEHNESKVNWEQIREEIEQFTGMLHIRNKLEGTDVTTKQEKTQSDEKNQFITEHDLSLRTEELGQLEQSLDGVTLKMKYFATQLDLLEKRV